MFIQQTWGVIASTISVLDAKSILWLLVEDNFHDLLVLWLVGAGAWHIEVVFVGVSAVQGVGWGAVLAGASNTRVGEVGWAWTALVLELAGLEAEREGWSLVVDTAWIVLALATQTRKAIGGPWCAVHG